MKKMNYEFKDIKKKSNVLDYKIIDSVEDSVGMTYHINNWKIVELKKWLSIKTGGV